MLAGEKKGKRVRIISKASRVSFVCFNFRKPFTVARGKKRPDNNYSVKQKKDPRSYYATKAVAKRKLETEKNSDLNGIRTHGLCDAGAVLYQLSYQANRKLVIL